MNAYNADSPTTSDLQTNFSFVSESENIHLKKPLRSKRVGAFTDNMALPVHRWFRYSAGFSAEWVEQLIERHGLSSDQLVLDPFVGSGTTLLAAQCKNVQSIGAESHYFVRRIANAKLQWRTTSERELLEAALTVLDKAKARLPTQQMPGSKLLLKCYTPEALLRLAAIRDAFSEHAASDGQASELLWLAITSILRDCSGVGTAQWQYILPNKTKARAQEPFAALLSRVKMFSTDMYEMKRRGIGSDSRVEPTDARNLATLAEARGRVQLVVTSPPYPNNYDYADATRLEMTFWGEVESWGDLQQAVRQHLIHSCSQHTAAERLSLAELLSREEISPIRAELTQVCTQLEKIRESKGGKKTYHTMVAAYFNDLAVTWRALRPLCADKSNVYFVIGDSAPYGIYVPAERWLGELALAAGFRTWSFEKIRDRNIKWKNRKHRVPLKEGTLWVQA